ncbi:hypothetical protein J3L18_29570 [Mucilaginibacter gossypii]|uniref:hypothetical protein n=1 Tax=Mucilaginibacter gossypii TaxID=551996 RepID=UPI000DCBFB49|nr:MULTISPECIES: hypothetical protein [Mucilaginibacter]QTE37207.1 hypothetical protein J3L18_29570 [Mucilaginibacter gossypii]RAV57170.1 hypothetical protein DIU36_12660 [Mucilaginibacter rubeus]
MNQDTQPDKYKPLYEAFEHLAEALKIVGITSLQIDTVKDEIKFERAAYLNPIALIEMRDTMKPLPYLVDIDNRPAFSFDANPPHMAYPEYHD